MTKIKIVLSHSGKQHSYYVARALNRLGILEFFFTSTYVSSKFLQGFLAKYLAKRFLVGLSGSIVKGNFTYELKEIVLRKLYGNSERVLHAVYNRDASFDLSISKKLPKTKATIFWGFQGSCLETLKAANKMGIISILEMAGVHNLYIEKLVSYCKENYSEFIESSKAYEYPTWYSDRLVNETKNAKVIFVASSFTKKTMIEQGIDPKKLFVLPLGTSLELAKPNFDHKINTDTVNLLFVGRLSFYKGIYFLLEAMKTLSSKNVTLTCIGHIPGDGSHLESYKHLFTYLGPMSQAELFTKYADYDLLVLPTLHDGFGLVYLEAMGCGLPAIGSENSAAPDLIEEGKNGYIIPAFSTEEIINKVLRYKALSETQRREMKVNAYNTYLQNTWEKYEEKVTSVLKQII